MFPKSIGLLDLNWLLMVRSGLPEAISNHLMAA